MDICKQVGKKIRHLREQKGWSQEQLAFEAELHRTYISGIERGVRNPTITIIARIAACLEVQPSQLLSKRR